jgi:hypothetical protein
MWLQECSCGSGQCPQAKHDARGIFLTFACDACEESKLAQFRPEVLTDPNYECDEAIDE